MQVRFWILLLLSGQSTVVINAKFVDGTLIVDRPDSIVADSVFISTEDNHD